MIEVIIPYRSLYDPKRIIDGWRPFAFIPSVVNWLTENEIPYVHEPDGRVAPDFGDIVLFFDEASAVAFRLAWMS